jgi:hypothetical protein
MPSGIEPFAKALIGPIAKPVGKKLKETILGPAEVNAFVTVCDKTLHLVIERVLSPYQVGKEQGAHVWAVLSKALNLAAAPDMLVKSTDDQERTSRLEQLLEQLRDSKFFDADTLQIEDGGKVIPIDVAEILQLYLTELPLQLRIAAEGHDSPLFEFVTLDTLSTLQEMLVEQKVLLRQLQQATNLVPSKPTAAARASRITRYEIDRKVSGGRDLFIDSFVLGEASKYLEILDWHSIVVDHFKTIDSCWSVYQYLASDSDLMALLTSNKRLTYASLHRSIRRLPLAKMQADLAAQAGQIKVEEARRASTSIRWMQRQAITPDFGYCFGVVGSWGSGRTRLLAEFASYVLSDNDFAVFVDTVSPTPLEERVLAAAGQLFDGKFAELSDLDAFLDEVMAANLCILLDDVELGAQMRPDFAQELQGLLEKATAARRLRWVLTVDELHLDAVLTSERPHFWTNYCFVSKELRGDFMHTGGWLDLDAANIREQLVS